MDSDMRQMALRARAAGRQLALKSSTARNATLEEIARRLEQVGERLWEANRADVELARQDGLVPALLDRSTPKPTRVFGSSITSSNDRSARMGRKPRLLSSRSGL